MTLYLEESGTKGAPSIVFLHGAGISSWMWQQQVHDLRDFHCLNIDLPGHGQSSRQEWVSLAASADQVAAIIRERATAGRAHVVGLSLGGYIAMHLLERHTDCLERVVISGVTAAPLPRPQMTLLQMQVMSLVMKTPPMLRFQARMMQIQAEDYAVFAQNMRAVSRQALMRITREALTFQPSEHLRAVAVPTLIVAGGAELEIIRESVAILAEMLPNAEGGIVPGVHHGWNGEAPEVFSAMVRAWLSDRPLPPEIELVRHQDEKSSL